MGKARKSGNEKREILLKPLEGNPMNLAASELNDKKMVGNG